ncbi:MAG: hypothetical protein A2086_06070 [Spirochaetes bacterium GWD1_27_9]|nr:MAG: hypothetical protein A2Z98_10730 [Spirochaetes bacterium GWB1_27_13]OHD20356.1 MAG: hypothetical protein A2Y34_10305 [Spirochaetes bacterium GWC1_27_15]OHD35578.1 MAG: hypothetical protein A2086_06070 [Spirochaetes bacterium GWD1_27_9]
MKRAELLENIKEAMQRDKDLVESMNLRTDVEEWSSLSILTLIALYDELFNIELKSTDFEKIITIKDLVDIAKDKLEG